MPARHLIQTGEQQTAGDRRVHRAQFAACDAAFDAAAQQRLIVVSLAQRLYRRFAFRAVGVRPNYYAEDQEDAIVMLLEMT